MRLVSCLRAHSLRYKICCYTTRCFARLLRENLISPPRKPRRLTREPTPVAVEQAKPRIYDCRYHGLVEEVRNPGGYWACLECMANDAATCIATPASDQPAEQAASEEEA